MIEVKNLEKIYEIHQKEPGLKGSIKSLFHRKKIEKRALHNINLSIGEGEIIGLIGSNGAGKTTLTKILSGIIHPTSGDVKVLGFTPWERKNEYRRQMSVIMGQKAQLWWDLPALDGFLLLKEIYQIPEKQYRESIAHLSEALMIKDQLKTQVRRLSLGERMKVELMAALLHRPKVVFLDEPTIGLDLVAQKAVREFIQTYRQEYKPIMILTSHYMEDIEKLCKRVAIMKEGSFIYDGSLKTLNQNFSQTKTIVAILENQAPISFKNQFPKELGLISEQEDNRLMVTAPKEKTMEAAKYLLSHLEVSDLNIHEENISHTIEKLMLKGVHH